jgi:ATP-dependent DNA helicase PIF1
MSVDTLTSEQRNVLQYLLEGKSGFLTGGGGVGKSYLLSAIYTQLPGMRKRLDGKLLRIQMCALTGCAALLLGHKAKTVHSWAGIGLGKGTVQELYTKIKRNSKAIKNWHGTDLLIIDEISMMTGELFDKLNALAKRIRSDKRPFGGMQVLLVGDFFQLPPVTRNEEVVFAFESEAWKEIMGNAMNAMLAELTVIQRQKDEVFQAILREARVGALTPGSCTILRAHQGLDWRANKIKPTLLFPRRMEVEMINDSNLRSLTGQRHMYHATIAYDGKMPAGFTEKDEGFQRALQSFDNESAYAVDLELACEAQVMLIANLDPELGLVNGSRGVITEFCGGLPMVEFVNGVKKTIGQHAWPIEGYEFVSRSQIPLRLAYACTIHRSQGSSLDAALVDIGPGTFEYGQAYVALSRARSLEALYVHDFDPTAFRAHPKVVEFYRKIVWSPMKQLDMVMYFTPVTQDESKDEKPIYAETSRPIRAIRVVKEAADAAQPGAAAPAAEIAMLLEPPAAEIAEPSEPPAAEIAEPSEPLAAEPGTQINWLYDSVPSSWKKCLAPCEASLLALSAALDQREFLPSKEHIWSALSLAKDAVRVVILGQDPYPTPGNAHGLAFSVLPGVSIPASLKNIYKEMAADLGTVPVGGNLDGWVLQGILLLNTVLTVEAGAPQSHSKLGWEDVTDQIIRSIAAQQKQVIFVLWGKSAQAKKKLLSLYMGNGHRVFESAHPSPLSASKGFLGSKPFSTINRWLAEMGKEPISWTF